MAIYLSNEYDEVVDNDTKINALIHTIITIVTRWNYVARGKDAMSQTLTHSYLGY